MARHAWLVTAIILFLPTSLCYSDKLERIIRAAHTQSSISTSSATSPSSESLDDEVNNADGDSLRLFLVDHQREATNQPQSFDRSIRRFSASTWPVQRASIAPTQVDCRVKAFIDGEPSMEASIVELLVLDASNSTIENASETLFSWSSCHITNVGCSASDFPIFLHLNHTSRLVLNLSGPGECLNSTTLFASGSPSCFADPMALLGETYRFTVSLNTTSGCSDDSYIDVRFVENVIIESSSSSSESSSNGCHNEIRAIIEGQPALNFSEIEDLYLNASGSFLADSANHESCSGCEFSWKVCEWSALDLDCHAESVPAWLADLQTTQSSIVLLSKNPCSTAPSNDSVAVLCAPDLTDLLALTGRTFRFTVSVLFDLCNSSAFVDILFNPMETSSSSESSLSSLSSSSQESYYSSSSSAFSGGGSSESSGAVSLTPTYEPVPSQCQALHLVSNVTVTSTEIRINVSNSYDDQASVQMPQCPNCTFRWSVCDQYLQGSPLCPTAAAQLPDWLTSLSQSTSSSVSILQIPCPLNVDSLSGQVACAPSLDELSRWTGSPFYVTVFLSQPVLSCAINETFTVVINEAIPTLTPTSLPEPCGVIVDLLGAPFAQHNVSSSLVLDASRSHHSAAGAVGCTDCFFSWSVCHVLNRSSSGEASDCSEDDLPVPFQRLGASSILTISLDPLSNNSCGAMGAAPLDCPTFDPIALLWETYRFTVTVKTTRCERNQSIFVEFVERLVPTATLTPNPVVPPTASVPAIMTPVVTPPRTTIPSEVQTLTAEQLPINTTTPTSLPMMATKTPCLVTVVLSGGTADRTHGLSTDLVLDGSGSYVGDLQGCVDCTFHWDVCYWTDGSCSSLSSPSTWITAQAAAISSSTLRLSRIPCPGGAVSDVVCADSFADLYQLVGNSFQFTLHVSSNECYGSLSVIVTFVEENIFTCDRCVLFARTNVEEELQCYYISVSSLNSAVTLGLEIDPPNGLEVVESAFIDAKEWGARLWLTSGFAEGQIALQLPSSVSNVPSPVPYGVTSMPRCNQAAVSTTHCGQANVCDPDFHLFDERTQTCRCLVSNDPNTYCDESRDCLTTVSGTRCESPFALNHSNVHFHCPSVKISIGRAVVYTVSMSTPSASSGLLEIISLSETHRFHDQSIFFSGTDDTARTMQLSADSANHNFTVTGFSNFTVFDQTLRNFSFHGDYLQSSYRLSVQLLGTRVVGISHFVANKYRLRDIIIEDILELWGTSDIIVEGDVDGAGALQVSGDGATLSCYNPNNNTRSFSLVGVYSNSPVHGPMPMMFHLCGVGPSEVSIPVGGLVFLRSVCSDGGGPLQMVETNSRLVLAERVSLRFNIDELVQLDALSSIPKVTTCEWPSGVTIELISQLADSDLLPLLECGNMEADQLPLPTVAGDHEGYSLKVYDNTLWLQYVVPFPEPPGIPIGSYDCEYCVLFKWADDVDGMTCAFTTDNSTFSTELTAPYAEWWPSSMANALNVFDSYVVDEHEFDIEYEVALAGKGITWARIDEEYRSPITFFDIIEPPKCEQPPVNSAFCGEFNICDVYHTYNNQTQRCECTKADYGVDPICDNGECVQLIEHNDCDEPQEITGQKVKVNCNTLSVSFGTARMYKVPQKCGNGKGCALKIIKKLERANGALKMNPQAVVALQKIEIAGDASKENSVECNDDSTNQLYSLDNITIFSISKVKMITSQVVSNDLSTKIVLTGTTLADSKLVGKEIVASGIVIQGSVSTAFSSANLTTIQSATIFTGSSLLVGSAYTVLSGSFTGGGVIACSGYVTAYNPNFDTRLFDLKASKVIGNQLYMKRKKRMRPLSIRPPSSPNVNHEQTTAISSSFELCGFGPTQVEVPSDGALILRLTCADGGGPLQMTASNSLLTLNSAARIIVSEHQMQSTSTPTPHITRCTWPADLVVTFDTPPHASSVIRIIQCDVLNGGASLTTAPNVTGCTSETCQCSSKMDGSTLVVSAVCLPSDVSSSPSPSPNSSPQLRAVPNPGTPKDDAALIGGAVGGVLGGIIFFLILGLIWYCYVTWKEDTTISPVDFELDFGDYVVNPEPMPDTPTLPPLRSSATLWYPGQEQMDLPVPPSPSFLSSFAAFPSEDQIKSQYTGVYGYPVTPQPFPVPASELFPKEP